MFAFHVQRLGAHGGYTWLRVAASGLEAIFQPFHPVVTCGILSKADGSGEFTQMGLTDVPVPRCKEAPADAAVDREELVHRVASSSTFERSPRLRAFFLHVCRCALDNKPKRQRETPDWHLCV